MPPKRKATPASPTPSSARKRNRENEVELEWEKKEGAKDADSARRCRIRATTLPVRFTFRHVHGSTNGNVRYEHVLYLQNGGENFAYAQVPLPNHDCTVECKLDTTNRTLTLTYPSVTGDGVTNAQTSWSSVSPLNKQDDLEFGFEVFSHSAQILDFRCELE